MSMTDEALLALAVRSIHDRAAQPVLGDAILERKDTPDEWYDERVMRSLVGDSYGDWRRMTQTRLRNRFFRRAAKPDRRWCKLVAGYMMFGEWEDHWPLIEHLYPRPSIEEILHRMWSNAGISEMTYDESPFLGVLPKQDEYNALTERLREAHVLLTPREAVIRAAERCAAQAQSMQLPKRENVLTDLWRNEMDSQLRRYSRDLLEATYVRAPRRRRTR